MVPGAVRRYRIFASALCKGRMLGLLDTFLLMQRIFQIISLVSVAVVPLSILPAILYFRVKFVGFGVLLTLTIQWIPGINPVCACAHVGHDSEYNGTFHRS